MVGPCASYEARQQRMREREAIDASKAQAARAHVETIIGRWLAMRSDPMAYSSLELSRRRLDFEELTVPRVSHFAPR